MQFCWECGGPFHTVVACSRPRVAGDVGSVLAFDDLDKQCANHFLARQLTLKEKKRCLRLLSRSGVSVMGNMMKSSVSGVGRIGMDDAVSGDELVAKEGEDAEVLRIKIDGWNTLADAQVGFGKVD